MKKIKREVLIKRGWKSMIVLSEGEVFARGYKRIMYNPEKERVKLLRSSGTEI